MAGNRLILHTNGRIMTTASRGNQEKWFDAGKICGRTVSSVLSTTVPLFVERTGAYGAFRAEKEAVPVNIRDGLPE